jgi:hypothetical protein
VWPPGSSTPTLLGVVGGAAEIADDGTVAGNGIFNGGARPFRWHEDTGFEWLGTAGTPAWAYAVAGGTVVGVSGSKAAFFFAPT